MKKFGLILSVLMIFAFASNNIFAQEKVEGEKAKKECCAKDEAKTSAKKCDSKEMKAEAKHCDKEKMAGTKSDKSCCAKTEMKEASNIKPINSICPVMGEEIDPAVTTEHNGKVYAFCCPKCIDKFKSDPEKYLEKLSKLESKES